jgi:hypothetical protein
LTKSREKAWTRVLKLALKSTEIEPSETSFASWLTDQGGVYQVSNTTSSGIKPSERDDYAIENALGFAGSWLKTEKHDEIQNIMDWKLKQLPEELSSFSITLNHHSFDGSEQSVLAVRDAKAINRVLVLLGRELGGPVRSRPAVLAKEAAKKVEFERVKGRKPDSSRD